MNEQLFETALGVAVYAKYSRDRFGLNGARITSPVATVGIRLGG